MGAGFAGSARAQICPDEMTVFGYQYWGQLILVYWANGYPYYPAGGNGPGGAYSANPNAHANCTATTLSDAMAQGTASPPSSPGNSSLAIPMRNANPINISNGSSIGFSYGGVNDSSGIMLFPNYAAGTNAAMESISAYANRSYTISMLINAWAPPASNPNAMAVTLSVLGISQSLADSTFLAGLTSS